MDYTLIKTKSGATFPKNKDDWELLFGDITKQKLVDLHKQGYTIVVFTNQGGVESGKTKVSDLSHKFEAIHKEVGVPMVFLASTEMKSVYRKPNDGMFKVLQKLCKVDKDESFYCGDAAGRKQPPFKDFSSDDLLFSITLNMLFYTPEMLFKGHK
jgi:bifunctional polynucleotide phosphatase/kinase